VEALAHVVHKNRDIGASIASGSFQTDGMVIAPCSMKTLAAVAHGLSDNLIARAADVVLKERRRLVLMVRETPFNLAHLRNMTAVTEMGGIVFPPLPSFYNKPASIDEMVDHTVARVIDLLGIENELAPRWAGMKGKSAINLTSADSKRDNPLPDSAVAAPLSASAKAQPFGRHAQPLRDHAQLFLGWNGFSYQPFTGCVDSDRPTIEANVKFARQPGRAVG
jgi:polyprenyl P-hydroxybenzoate/phenylacrylic acid decarboxylase-like protein